MKKTLTILSIILLGAIGCTKNVFETPAREGGESDGMVEVSMTLDIPVEMIAATKAGEMSHLPSIDDIRALDAAGIPAVVFGKAIYEGKIDLHELINVI